MPTVVLDSKDLLTHLTTGETPVPEGVAEDNARQAEKGQKANGKQAEVKTVDKADKSAANASESKDDDVEGEDGLTPRQKREFSAAMLKSIGKKHREKLEAEEFAAAQYNERVLAEKRAETAEQEREAFKAELAKLKAPVQKAEPTEPQREKFATEQEYQDAMIDWRVDQRLQERTRQQAEERERSIQENCQSSLTRAIELVPDFQEVTSAAELNIPGHVVHLMRESGLFAEFGYHFAKNPDELAKLAIATPNKLKVEFQKIESKLTPFASRTAAGTEGKANGAKPSPSEAESASSTTAASANGADPSTRTESTGSGADPSKPRGTAPVITPLSAGSSSQVAKDPREMNAREMISAWQQKNQRNLGLRKRH